MKGYYPPVTGKLNTEATIFSREKERHKQNYVFILEMCLGCPPSLHRSVSQVHRGN